MSSKIAKFETELNKHIATQIREISEIFVWWGGGGQVCALHHTNVCKFSQLCKAISLLT